MRGLLILFATALLARSPASQNPSTGARTGTARSSATSHSTASKPAAAPALMTDDDKIIYALGLSISRSIGVFNLSPSELDILKRALTDGAAGKPAEDLQTWGPKIQAFAQARGAQAAARQKAASQDYLAKAAAAPGAITTPSGLVYRELTPGTGASPTPSDTVRVNYRGTLVDGTEFDSSYKRNEPAEFQLTGVIPCWTEGLQKMKVGGKAKLVCPSSLAYGDRGQPGIPGGAALTFEVELLGIGNGSQQAPAPAPQAPPPGH